MMPPRQVLEGEEDWELLAAYEAYVDQLPEGAVRWSAKPNRSARPHEPQAAWGEVRSA